MYFESYSDYAGFQDYIYNKEEDAKESFENQLLNDELEQLAKMSLEEAQEYYNTDETKAQIEQVVRDYHKMIA